MKKILLTGKTGFIGRNILPLLQEYYLVDAPSRQELNLQEQNTVYDRLRQGNYDAVLHLANPNPTKNSADSLSSMLKDSLHIFYNFVRASRHTQRIIYLGSGAEFDKGLDICSIDEEKFGRSIPTDVYGFSKYCMNEAALHSNNLYNLRIFACYGPHDHESKFITHAIQCGMENRPVTIRQDCMFDYMYVDDVAKAARFMLEAPLKYHDYNCCSGQRFTLSEIALEVCLQMGNENGIEVLSPGWNREYTGNNDRLCSEYYNVFGEEIELLSLREGIRRQIEWQRSSVR